MEPKDFNTPAVNTWCPGCGNFSIYNAFKAVLAELINGGQPLEKIVVVAGIGCHGKIADYFKVNSFYGLHGRTIPVAEGIKTARPDLKVICFAGDGDCYGEGLEHLLFAAKRNVDITVVVHNNRVYGLTTGQYTPTSPRGFPGRSTPYGTTEDPINPLELALAAGATYIARGYSVQMEQMKNLIKEAIVHRGFSLVDVLQVCVSFYNKYDMYNQNTYLLQDHDSSNYEKAIYKIREWRYNNEHKIALGRFYQESRPVFDDNFGSQQKPVDRDRSIKELLLKLK